MFDDYKINLNTILDIQPSGIRKLYKVITKSGKWIECTDNHKFPTENGIKQLKKLAIGDCLYSVSEFNYYSVIQKDKIVSIEYVREEMTYDVTMADPAHNFVANNGLVTCNSHAAAYAIIAYICMYLKTYHPKEFICACINSVNGKVEKIAECINEAVRLGIPIYMGKYNNCSPVTKVYKDGIMIGVGTIKGCNQNIANELMNISEKKNFIELLDAVSNTSINTAQLRTLVGLGYFSDYGKNGKLLTFLDAYNGISIKSKTVLPSFRTCKQISKDKIDSYIEEGNYKNRILFITKDINPGYFQDDDFLKFVNLMNNLGLDTQTAMRIFVKQCLRTSSIPFEIKC
jgi:hypothetical protein